MTKAKFSIKGLCIKGFRAVVELELHPHTKEGRCVETKVNKTRIVSRRVNTIYSRQLLRMM